MSKFLSESYLKISNAYIYISHWLNPVIRQKRACVCVGFLLKMYRGNIWFPAFYWKKGFPPPFLTL